MSEVKGRRGYDASGRRESARRRRSAIVAAAGNLFAREGFGVTIGEIAAVAQVSAETIYKSFGGKSALIARALDEALAGDDAPIAAADRDDVRAIQEQPDAVRKIEQYAVIAQARSERAGRLMLAVRDGARADADLAKLWDSLLSQRLAGVGAFAQHLSQCGALRPGVGIDHARDTLWTLTAPEIWELLVVLRGWPGEQYRDWIARAAAAELL